MLNLSPYMDSELKKAVRSFNSKISRLEKKGVTPSLLPRRLRVRDLKNAYDDIESLNARLRRINSFTSAGEVRTNKYGVRATEAMFEYRESQKQQGVIPHLKQQNQMIRSKPRYVGRQREYISNNLAKIKYLSKSSRRRDARALNIEVSNMLEPEDFVRKNEIFRENYYKTLDDYAGIAGVDKKTIAQLKRKMNQIPSKDFYRVVSNNPEFDNIFIMMGDSPEGRDKGVKQSQPRFTEDEIEENIYDLLENLDNIILNTD